jgi:hypothetical protein
MHWDLRNVACFQDRVIHKARPFKRPRFPYSAEKLAKLHGNFLG